MATTRRTRFSRRIPDHLTDELVVVLSNPDTYQFNALFGLVYANLKEKNAVSGGEEMLRLRAYEKLQNLVTRGLVEKSLKTYRGLDRIEEASSAWAAAQAAKAIEEEEKAEAKKAKAAATAAAKPKPKAKAKAKPKAKATAKAKAK